MSPYARPIASRADLLVALWCGSLSAGAVESMVSIAAQREGVVTYARGWLALTDSGVRAALPLVAARAAS